MTDAWDAPRVAIRLSRGLVVASIQVDLSEPVLERFRDELHATVHEHGARGVVLDLSAVEILDAVEWAALRTALAGVVLLGAQAVVAGLQPGVVASLVESGADVDGVQAFFDLDGAVRWFHEGGGAGDGVAPADGPALDGDVDATDAWPTEGSTTDDGAIDGGATDGGAIDGGATDDGPLPGGRGGSWP